MPQLFVPPSQLETTGTIPAGQFLRGIPSIDTPFAVGGLNASPNNLLLDSPPTILEQYVINAYSIPFGALAQQAIGEPQPTVITAELALLVNGDVAQVNTMANAPDIVMADQTAYSDTWTADLVNPITVGSRDRLSVRVGIKTNATATVLQLVVGLQDVLGEGGALEQATNTATLTYTTIELPASRRL